MCIDISMRTWLAMVIVSVYQQHVSTKVKGARA
jgi:hypothetical protein